MISKRTRNKELAQVISEEDAYYQIVQNYMNFSGRGIISYLADMCEMNNGKLTYFQMEMVLGRHYPKPSWQDKSNRKECIKTFMQYAGFIYYIADEEYIFFP